MKDEPTERSTDKDELELERVKIAMEEYKVLHAEILQRNTTLVQVGSVGIVVLVTSISLWVGGSLQRWPALILIAGFIVAVVTALVIVHSDTKNASQRIGEIEEYVNKAVGGDGRNPLSWERRFGLAGRGYRDRFRRFDPDKR